MRRYVVLALLGLVASALVATPAVAGGGCHQQADEVTTGKTDGSTTVPMAECAFAPTVLFVDPGTKVTWVNADPGPHTVTGALGGWGDTKYIESGDKVSWRFDDPGIYPYSCVLHAGMTGAVVVGSVAAARGAAEPIELAGLPVNSDPNLGDTSTASGQRQTRPASSSGWVWPAAGAALAFVLGASVSSWRRRRLGLALGSSVRG